MDNYRSEGKDVKLAHASAVVSGEAILVQGKLIVAVGSYAANEEGVYLLEGRVALPLKSGDAPVELQLAYWDDTNKELTVTDTGNTLVGRFLAVNGDLAEVKLA